MWTTKGYDLLCDLSIIFLQFFKAVLISLKKLIKPTLNLHKISLTTGAIALHNYLLSVFVLHMGDIYLYSQPAIRGHRRNSAHKSSIRYL